jgi:hypothetical protein
MLTDKALERAARALALACNGGDWDVDYKDEHKELWRQRVRVAMRVTSGSFEVRQGSMNPT